MTSFSTDSFKFFTFDSINPEHQKFLYTLEHDQNVTRYIKTLSEFCNVPDSEDILNNAYLVGLNDNIVGYLNLINRDQVEEMHYAVSQDFRGIRNTLNETIGCRIVKEASSTLFRAFKQIKYLRLYIEMGNIRSIKTAEAAGFVLADTHPHTLEYRKYSDNDGDMSFSTENFDFLTFDKNNKEHQEVLAKLKIDPEIQEYFGNIYNYFPNEDEYEEDNSGTFLVVRGKDIVGFISIYDYYKIQELHYGLLPTYRGIKVSKEHTIGSQMVLEATNELFKRYPYIEVFRAYINACNIKSSKMAQKAGFISINNPPTVGGEYQKTRKL